jgi:CRP-like cAMP-binding protein
LTEQSLRDDRLREMNSFSGKATKSRPFIFIEEGRLLPDRRTFDGRSLVFGTSSAGEFFVEAALFAEIFHCDAVANEPSRVRIYPKAAVLKALNTDPSSALPFLRLMAHQDRGQATPRTDEDPLCEGPHDVIS